MAVAHDVAQEIARLKEQSNALEAELQQQQERTQGLQAQEQRADEALAKLRSQQAEAAAARAAEAMAAEQARLDTEASVVAAVKAEVDEHRAKAADIIAQLREARDSTNVRIAKALVEPQNASSARLAEATSAWCCETEVLKDRILACESELPSLRVEAAESRQRVRCLRRRTAVARLGRAAAAWQHQLRVRGLQQKARRERAASLRKLTREGEELQKEVTCRHEALNQEFRRAEQEDDKARAARKDEIQGLRDELELVEDDIEVLEDRIRNKKILADTVDQVPLSEGDRIRRWAEAASGVGSANFRKAADRLQRRSLISVLDAEEDDVRSRGSRKLQGTASAPSLPRLRGGLQQLEDQIQGWHR